MWFGLLLIILQQQQQRVVLENRIKNASLTLWDLSLPSLGDSTGLNAH